MFISPQKCQVRGHRQSDRNQRDTKLQIILRQCYRKQTIISFLNSADQIIDIGPPDQDFVFFCLLNSQLFGIHEVFIFIGYPCFLYFVARKQLAVSCVGQWYAIAGQSHLLFGGKYLSIRVCIYP